MSSFSVDENHYRCKYTGGTQHNNTWESGGGGGGGAMTLEL